MERLARIGSHLPRESGPAANPITTPAAGDGQLITDEMKVQWERDGFVVIRACVDKATVDAVVADIWSFLRMDPADATTWYEYEPGMTRVLGAENTGENTMLNMWEHQSMWDVRQHPRVYQAFRELWGTPRLTVSIDTADMKPPRRADLEGWGAPLRLHMDLDDAFLAAGPLAPPRVSEDGGGALWNRARCAQGVLQLAETTADGGGFRCLPGFHRRAQPPAPLPHVWPPAEGRRWRAGWEEWQRRFPGQNPNEWLAPEVIEENLASGEWGEILDVGGGPGDLIIWVNALTRLRRACCWLTRPRAAGQDSFLPHGNGVNTAQQPRLAQYVNMWPDWAQQPGHRSSPDKKEDTERRVRMWKERLPGGCYDWPPLEAPDPRAREELRPGEPARLTALGRRLLGADSWGE